MKENNNIDKSNVQMTLGKKNEEELVKESKSKFENNNNNKKNIISYDKNIIKLDISKNSFFEKENQTEVNDYLIKIKYSKLLCIPYFYFGNIFHFYFSCQSFSSNPIKISEMPTPPFAVIRSECKYLYYLFIEIYRYKNINYINHNLYLFSSYACYSVCSFN